MHVQQVCCYRWEQAPSGGEILGNCSTFNSKVGPAWQNWERTWFILKQSYFKAFFDPNENLLLQRSPQNCTERTFKGQSYIWSHGKAYEHDISKHALFVISHNLHDSVPVNVSRVSFNSKLTWSLLLWSCDVTFDGIWYRTSRGFGFISFLFFFFKFMFSLSHGSNPCAWLVNLGERERIIWALKLPFAFWWDSSPTGLFQQPNMDLLTGCWFSWERLCWLEVQADSTITETSLPQPTDRII